MKKNLFFAAVFVLGMTALGSCSSSEGDNAANDESVVGATDGMETVDESAVEVENTDELPGNIIGEETTVTQTEATEETGTEDGKSLVEKGKDLLEKGKDAVEKGKDVVVEKGKDAVDKSKDLLEKGKDAVEKGKDMLEKLK